MKFYSTLLAIAALAMCAAPASAKKAFQCVDGVLYGGPEGFVCSTDAEGKIVDIRRPQGYGYSAHGDVTTHSYTGGAYETYTRSQTELQGGPDASADVVYRRRSMHREQVKPRVTRTYTYSAPVNRAYPSEPEAHGVRVYRGGYAGSSRPCSHHYKRHDVTTYTGCPYAQREVRYEHSRELHGGYHEERAYQPRPRRESVPVVGVQRGYCQQAIRRLGEDRDGRKRYEVCFSDLQPVHGTRVEQLYDRIETAARRACRGQAGYGAWSRRDDCEDQAVEEAVYDTGLLPLATYHANVTGQRIPNVKVGPLRRY